MSSRSGESKIDLSWVRSELPSAAARPIDNASITLFRVAFGLTMAWWAWDYLTSGRVRTLYVDPAFNFSYYGFGWVQPWPGNGMYFHFLVLTLLGLCIAVGLFYRTAAVLFALGFTYFFLLERTNYQNHYYLIALFSWWMPLLPLHRNVSIDAWRKPGLLSQTTPAWVWWVLLFHVSVPYFFGGVAKFSPDWLLGQPMGIMLASKSSVPLIGEFLSWPPLGILLTSFGLLFDLSVVPLLLWRRTRILAFLLCVGFHISNSLLFNIHIFPWFMLAATTLYFDPSWPRRVLASGAPLTSSLSKDRSENDRSKRPSVTAASSEPWTASGRIKFACVAAYVVFHFVWPLRHNLYPGDASWNERGHLFAWRMMLRGKEVGIGYALRDPANGRVANIDHKQFLAAEQSEKFPRDPEMILAMAHFLADEFETATQRRPEIYAFVLTSLNGRKPQLQVDPNVDLAAQPRGIYWSRDWVLPLTEPLRSPPWDVPIDAWRQYVELPEIGFLKDMRAQSDNNSEPDEDS